MSRILGSVAGPIDDATEQFLEAAADDLQQQLGVAGDLEMLRADQAPIGVTLVARITVAKRTIEVEGQGDSLVTAYADLRRRVAEPTLLAAYFQVVLDWPRTPGR